MCFFVVQFFCRDKFLRSFFPLFCFVSSFYSSVVLHFMFLFVFLFNSLKFSLPPPGLLEFPFSRIWFVYLILAPICSLPSISIKARLLSCWKKRFNSLDCVCFLLSHFVDVCFGGMQTEVSTGNISLKHF